MRPHLQYLWYVLRHKWHVYRAGRALGVEQWQLLVHDWTKFLPVEWFPYVERYFGKQRYPDAYDSAWEHHWRSNPHHWQYWTTRNRRMVDRISHTDDPEVDCLPMPKKFAREMVADWIGAGLAQGKPDVVAWYEDHQEKMILHEDTRAEVVYWLQTAAQKGIIPRR